MCASSVCVCGSITDLMIVSWLALLHMSLFSQYAHAWIQEEHHAEPQSSRSQGDGRMQ